MPLLPWTQTPRRARLLGPSVAECRRSRGRPVVDGRTDTDGHNQPGAGASGVSPLGAGAEEARQRLDTPLAEASCARSREPPDEHRPRAAGGDAKAFRLHPGHRTGP